MDREAWWATVHLATEQQQWSSHALSEPTVLPRSPRVHQLGRPLSSVLLTFYGGFNKKTLLITSSSIGN